MRPTLAIFHGIGALAMGALAACYGGVRSGSSLVGEDGGDAGSGLGTDGPAGSEESAGSAESGESDDSEESDDSDGGRPVECTGPADVGPTPLRRLTRREYANAVADLLGVEANVASLDTDEKLAAFDSNLAAPVSPALVMQYRVLAEDVAAAALADLPTLVACVPTDVAGDPAAAAACTQAFVASFGRRAFRRPLAAAELEAYTQLGSRGTEFVDGIRLVITGVLQSVHFLYHVELAPADTPAELIALDDYQLAARLSFFLWGSIPDDALLDAAAAGELTNPIRLRTEAERMLQSERAANAVQSFHLQWLGLDKGDSVIKAVDVYPAFDDALRTAMLQETERFVAHTVLDGDARLMTLMTSSQSFLDGPLFELYGVAPPANHDPLVPVAIDPAQRAGLLTQASFMTTHAHNDSSGPIQRGVVVRRNVLCQPLPPPPANVPELGPVDPNATTRERFEQHATDPTCASCHVLIDGIGLAMENYDGIGRYRTHENGKSIDASGKLLGTDVDGEFDGAVQLAHKLAGSEVVRDCVALQWFRFAFGRGEAMQDDCTIDALSTTFGASDGNVRELMLAIVMSDAFRNLRVQ